MLLKYHIFITPNSAAWARLLLRLSAADWPNRDAGRFHFGQLITPRFTAAIVGFDYRQVLSLADGIAQISEGPQWHDVETITRHS